MEILTIPVCNILTSTDIEIETFWIHSTLGQREGTQISLEASKIYLNILQWFGRFLYFTIYYTKATAKQMESIWITSIPLSEPLNLLKVRIQMYKAERNVYLCKIYQLRYYFYNMHIMAAVAEKTGSKM